MELEQIRKNKNSMILQFAVPSIIAMVLTALITVVDGFFVGNYVGKEGMAAVNLGIPIVYLFLAMGLMLAVGGMAISGRQLGAGEIKICHDVFNQTMLLCWCQHCLALSYICVLNRFCLFCVQMVRWRFILRSITRSCCLNCRLW